MSEIHARALAPVEPKNDEVTSSVSAARKKTGTHHGRRRFLVPAVVVALLAAVVGGVSLMERTRPGSILDQTEPPQSVASDAWGVALAATTEFRESASRDLSIVLDKMRNVTEDIVGETLDEAEEDDAPEADSSSSQSRRAEPSPDVSPEPGTGVAGPAAFDGGEGAIEPDTVGITQVAAVSDVRELGEAVDPGVSAELFDSRDVNVTPPATIRHKLPTLADEAAWNEQIGVVETIISASGSVEQVKLLSPPESVHQAMILSAIKTWRFRPAELDGLPVRYRQLIQVAIPR